jgi:hypothetical protein
VSCLLLGLHQARAEDRYFIGLPNGGTANWSEPANWTDSVVPQPGDAAIIDFRDALDRAVVLDISSSLSFLTIGNLGGGGSSTLYQLPGIDLVTESEYVGSYPTSEYGVSIGRHIQDGGSNTTTDLWVGTPTADQMRVSIGTYTLNGGTVNASYVHVASVGFGTFEHNGGVVSISSSGPTGGELNVGQTQGSSGIYKMHDGKLTVVGLEYLGYSGAGTFIQTGGTHTLVGTGSLLGILSLGMTSVGTGGTYILSGTGATLVTDTELIARHNRGAFIQSAGVHQVRSQCVVGYLSTAHYDLSGGSFRVAAELDIGYGTMNQSGGAVEVGVASSNNGLLWISSYGLFSLTSDTGSVAVWGDEYVRGTFNQTAGAHSVSANLYVQGSKGTYFLSGGALSTPVLNIAEGGRFDWSGGALSLQTLLLAGRMNLAPGSGRTLVATNVEIDRTTGMLDLADNHMIVDYPVGESSENLLDNLRQDLRAGALFTSLDSDGHRLGYADNAVLERPSFAGVSFPPNDFTQLLVMYTYAGDSNLDGVVDMMDLGALATHWQTANVWTGGDFDYSGFVDVADLGLLASNWQAGVTLGSTPTDGHPWALAEALAALGLPAPLPEPASVTILLGTGFFILRRRKNRSTSPPPT